MLAKGKVFVNMEKLAEILSLPEGVEVIAVKPKGSAEEGFEFLVMSAEETVCTKKNVGMNLLRRTSVDTLEKFKSGNKDEPVIVASGSFVVESVPFPEVVLHSKGETILTKEQAMKLFDTAIKAVENLPKKEKTVKDSFEDILNAQRKKGKF